MNRARVSVNNFLFARKTNTRARAGEELERENFGPSFPNVGAVT